MKKSYLFLGLLSLASCTQNELVEPSVPQNQESGQQEVKGIVMTGVDYTFDGIASRSQVNHVVTPGGKVNISFQWKAGDMVGIFPMASNDGSEIKNEGTQVTFPMADGAGTNQAKFDGGGWALKSGYKYASYFPLIDQLLGLDKTKIPVSYANPVYREVPKDGNVTVDLGKSDFMTAEASAADASGNINFEFHHTGALIILNTELTNDRFTQVKSIKLTGYNPQDNTPVKFVVNGHVDLTKPLQTSESGTRKYHQFEAGTQPGDEVTELVFDCSEANQTPEEKKQWTFPIYFTMAPQMNLADMMLELTFTYSTANLDGNIEEDKNRIFVTKNIEPGKAYIWHGFQKSTDMDIFYVDVPGTLSKMMGPNNAETKLTVKGTINEADFAHIKTLTNLPEIYLFDVTIDGAKPFPAGVFDNMNKLTRIGLPKSIKDIDKEAFKNFKNAANCRLLLHENFADLVSVEADGKYSFAGATFKWVNLILPPNEYGYENDGTFFDVYAATHTINAHYDDMIYAGNITQALAGGTALKVTGKLSDRDLKAIAGYTTKVITSLTFDNIGEYVPTTADVFAGCTYSANCDLVIPDAWKSKVSMVDGRLMMCGATWKSVKDKNGVDIITGVDPNPEIGPWNPGEGGDLETE